MSKELLAYASRTGTRKNLEALRLHGWRLLVSAAACLRNEGFPYALDNGAWSAFTQNRPFDFPAFEKALSKMGSGADWTVVPDIVAGGLSSLELSLSWLPRVLSSSPRALIAVQDGMRTCDLRPFLGRNVGIFVGGSTEWKLRTMLDWSVLGKEVGCWVHVGRVNTCTRIRLCSLYGVDSFDGTSASRYSKNVPMMDRARRQKSFFYGASR